MRETSGTVGAPVFRRDAGILFQREERIVFSLRFSNVEAALTNQRLLYLSYGLGLGQRWPISAMKAIDWVVVVVMFIFSRRRWGWGRSRLQRLSDPEYTRVSLPLSQIETLQLTYDGPSSYRLVAAGTGSHEVYELDHDWPQEMKLTAATTAQWSMTFGERAEALDWFEAIDLNRTANGGVPLTPPNLPEPASG